MTTSGTTKPRPQRRRLLSDHERELWITATRAITPLRPAAAPERVREPVETVPTAPALGSIRQPARPLPGPKDLAPFDRRLRQRLARGVIKVDASIDLHGLTLSKAHTTLTGFLTRARTSGARVVLVITGKGRSRGTAGVLRQHVPVWLKSAGLREHVLAFAAAHSGHGGEGALYVRLRRVPAAVDHLSPIG
jgi:DNA-nicking Smr family endonuclease